jgi:hypothetical protein
MGSLGSFFGDAKQTTTSTSTSQTNQVDSSMQFNRDVSGLSAVTQSGSGNKNYAAGSVTNELQLEGTGNHVTMTDFGAVSKSLDAMVRGVEQSTALATLVTKQAGEQQQLNISTGADLLNNVLSSTKKQADELTTAVVDLKTSDVRVLVIGALAIVGAVIAVVMKKG